MAGPFVIDEAPLFPQVRSELERNKYLKFVQIESKTKTQVWEVISKLHDYTLGTIKWFPRWRQYAFMPENGMVFNPDCLITISAFIKNLMAERAKGHSK